MTRPISRPRALFLAPLLFVLGCPAPSEVPDGPPEDLDLILSEDRPSKRSEVLAVADEASNSIVVFGGNQGVIVSQIPRADYLDDTWVFEPGFGWTEVEGDGPSARGRYATAYDRVGHRMLLFGGRYRPTGETGDYSLRRDLWAFDFTTRTWSELDAGDEGPSGRYYPVAAWDEEGAALYLYGGAVNRDALIIQPSSELWRWTDGGGWEELSTSGDAPSSRVFFGSDWDAQRRELLLFAGQIGDFQSLAYNDLYALSLPSGAWRELHPGGDGAPFTRMHPAIRVDAARDRLLLFGGHTDIGDNNDLRAFPLSDDSWEEVYIADEVMGGLGCNGNASEVPQSFVEQDLSAPERRHRGLHAILWDSLFVFGGMHSECSDHLDDTWRFDLATSRWHELIPARSGESCLRRGEDCQCLCN